MPTPVSTRPASIPASPVAAALSSGPASMGTASSKKARRRPSESARLAPARLPTAAPASRLLTTCGWGGVGGDGWVTWGQGGRRHDAISGLPQNSESNAPGKRQRPTPPWLPPHHALQQRAAAKAQLRRHLLERPVDHAQVVPKGQGAAGGDLGSRAVGGGGGVRPGA